MDWRLPLSLCIKLWLSALRRKAGPVYHNRRGAIRGYDPVAYFREGRAIKGQRNISYPWKGAVWYFCSESHRDQFAADAEKYAPAFGGFCAYGVHNGYKIHADPGAWTIYKGKLYLNYSPVVRDRWLADPEHYIKEARQHWEVLKTRP